MPATRCGLPEVACGGARGDNTGVTSDAIALSALTAFVEGTARAAGEGFFAALTRNLAQMLQVRDAIVTELSKL